MTSSIYYVAVAGERTSGPGQRADLSEHNV